MRCGPGPAPARKGDEGLMAKIRAYKLAEELGMERAEFVEKAGAAGVELRSARDHHPGAR